MRVTCGNAEGQSCQLCICGFYLWKGVMQEGSCPEGSVMQLAGLVGSCCWCHRFVGAGEQQVLVLPVSLCHDGFMCVRHLGTLE